MIEEIVLKYLESELTVPVFMTEPERPPVKYVKIQKTGAGVRNWIRTATIAIQSYGPTMLDAATLNEQIVRAMLQAPELDEISSCELNSDYNFTDSETGRYRYQAVFDLVYFM